MCVSFYVCVFVSVCFFIHIAREAMAVCMCVFFVFLSECVLDFANVCSSVSLCLHISEHACTVSMCYACMCVYMCEQRDVARKPLYK